MTMTSIVNVKDYVSLYLSIRRFLSRAEQWSWDMFQSKRFVALDSSFVCNVAPEAQSCPCAHWCSQSRVIHGPCERPTLCNGPVVLATSGKTKKERKIFFLPFSLDTRVFAKAEQRTGKDRDLWRKMEKKQDTMKSYEICVNVSWSSYPTRTRFSSQVVWQTTNAKQSLLVRPRCAFKRKDKPPPHVSLLSHFPLARSLSLSSIFLRLKLGLTAHKEKPLQNMDMLSTSWSSVSTDHSSVDSTDESLLFTPSQLSPVYIDTCVKSNPSLIIKVDFDGETVELPVYALRRRNALVPPSLVAIQHWTKHRKKYSLQTKRKLSPYPTSPALPLASVIMICIDFLTLSFSVIDNPPSFLPSLYCIFVFICFFSFCYIVKSDSVRLNKIPSNCLLLYF